MASVGRKRYFCGHCEDYVGKTAYYQHRRLYFQARSNKWSKERLFTSAEESCNSRSHEPCPSTWSEYSMIDTSSASIRQEGHELLEEDYEEECGEGSGQDSSDEDCKVEECSSELDEGPELLVGTEDDFLLEEVCSTPSLPATTHIQSNTDKLLRLYVFFIFMFQTIFRLSDAAIGMLFLFFSTFLGTIGRHLRLESLQQFASKLPRNIRSARVIAGRQSQPFRKYVCCRACRTLYEWDKCTVQEPDKSISSRLCEHVEFPNHPQHWRRKPCDKPLLKKVQLSGGRIRLMPYLVYCYKSIVDSLQEMILRQGFLEKCELWRKAACSVSEYRDVYDGNVWKDFQSVGGKQFLSLPYNFALHLNVDWFQPYKHTQHSEGVMYVTVLNLPRSDRFLQENVIIVGVIPGPSEPKIHINTFLKPFVNELKDLWDGVVMQSLEQSRIVVRAALLCVGCDIPAARKCCGFVGHSAYRGCSKCLTPFPTGSFGEKADYSNFVRSSWILRSGSDHMKRAYEFKECETKAKRKIIEREFGVRFSVLVELPYFDMPRMCIVDPMHNLLLGTCKHMVELWKDIGILKDKDFELIQNRVDGFIAPSDIGRLPSKISSGFAGFTAEQWKNWACLFSLVALKGVIPWRHYHCWLLFVKACSLLCRRSISVQQLQKADELLMDFCDSFTDLYGKEHCTMNMHLHGHLSTCIRDFGPVYSFWLFSFERMNGILGSYHTNNHLISVQLIQRFLDYKLYAVYNWPQDFQSEYSSLLKDCHYSKGSLVQVTFETENASIPSYTVEPLPPIVNYAFSPDDLASLRSWATFNVSSDILLLHRRCKAIRVCNIVIGSSNSRYSKSSIVSAYKVSGNVCLGEVLCFAEVVSKHDSKAETQWVVAVKWFEQHQCNVWFGYPTEVWCSTQEPGYSFIPLSAVKSRVVHSRMSVNFGKVLGIQSVLVAVPLEHNISSFSFS